MPHRNAPLSETGRLRLAREAADTLAFLIETAADLHIDDLAKKLGIDTNANPDRGEEINKLLRG